MRAGDGGERAVWRLLGVEEHSEEMELGCSGKRPARCLSGHGNQQLCDGGRGTALTFKHLAAIGVAEASQAKADTDFLPIADMCLCSSSRPGLPARRALHLSAAC